MIDFRKMQAVIWDMDGVLVDSEPIHADTWKQVFDKYQIPITREQLKSVFGMTSEMTIRKLTDRQLDEKIINEMVKEKARLFQYEIREKATFLPGVKGWLESFKNNGVMQAVASSGTRRNVEIVIEQLHINEFFSVVMNGDGIPGKPDPYIFIKAAQALGVIPLNCLVIEDSVAGVMAAKAAGMKCVGVATTNAKDKLLDADVVVENLAQLKTDQVKALFLQ